MHFFESVCVMQLCYICLCMCVYIIYRNMSANVFVRCCAICLCLSLARSPSVPPSLTPSRARAVSLITELHAGCLLEHRRAQAGKCKAGASACFIKLTKNKPSHSPSQTFENARMESAQWHILLTSRAEMQTRKNTKCIRKKILEHRGAGPRSL